MKASRVVTALRLALPLALGFVLAFPATADAHATLVAAQPAPRSHLAMAPTRAWLQFDEQIEPALARLSLIGADGDVTRLRVTSDPHDVRAIAAPLPSLPVGAYRVSWRVVSADGHPVEGSFVFWVGSGSVAAPPENPAALAAPATWGVTMLGAPLVPAILSGLAVGSLMALAGLLLFLWWPESGARPAVPVAASLAAWLAAAAPILLSLHVAAWAVNAAPDHLLTSDSVAALWASREGTAELWRTGLAIVALWALWLARRPRWALVAAIGALLASGATGHAAAVHPMWAIPAKALHLLAGAAWLGGLLWLAPQVRADRATLVRAARRVSSVALIACLLVAASGILQALILLPAPLVALRSRYGAVLLAKAAGLVVLAGFGAYHRYRLLPNLDDGQSSVSRFGPSLRREIVVFCLVVLLGGLLSYVPPTTPMSMASAETSSSSSTPAHPH